MQLGLEKTLKQDWNKKYDTTSLSSVSRNSTRLVFLKRNLFQNSRNETTNSDHTQRGQAAVTVQQTAIYIFTAVL